MKKSILILSLSVFILLTAQLYIVSPLSFREFIVRLFEMPFVYFFFNFIPGIILKISDAHSRGIHFYEISGFVILVTFFLLSIEKKLLKEKGHPGLTDIVQICLMLVLIITSIRAVSQLDIAGNIRKKFLGKTADEKMRSAYQVIHLFAKEAQKVLPERTSAELITGYSGRRNMQVRMQLAYMLYPIDLRGIRAEETQALLILNKTHAVKFVPKDFVVVSQWDDRTLIAVRKKESG